MKSELVVEVRYVDICRV